MPLAVLSLPECAKTYLRQYRIQTIAGILTRVPAINERGKDGRGRKSGKVKRGRKSRGIRLDHKSTIKMADFKVQTGTSTNTHVYQLLGTQSKGYSDVCGIQLSHRTAGNVNLCTTYLVVRKYKIATSKSGNHRYLGLSAR